MVAKSDLKLIKSLHQKKYRIRHGLFLAEGVKLVEELLASRLKPYKVFSTGANQGDGLLPITANELGKVSALKQPNKMLGVFHIPEPELPRFTGWTLALDALRDPGNLGTVIRLCDWFGIEDLLCSPDTVDCYNPKVLQATMGSIARVRIHYLPLADTLEGCGLPVFGASMEGVDIRRAALPTSGVLVMGSESHGLSVQLRAVLSETLAIPAYGKAESLNVATATAVLLHEIRKADPGLIQK